jgi:hypothetical protein
MKGWVLIEPAGMESPQEFETWITLALAFNTTAKSAKKKNK